MNTTEYTMTSVKNLKSSSESLKSEDLPIHFLWTLFF